MGFHLPPYHLSVFILSYDKSKWSNNDNKQLPFLGFPHVLDLKYPDMNAPIGNSIPLFGLNEPYVPIVQRVNVSVHGKRPESIVNVRLRRYFLHCT